MNDNAGLLAPLAAHSAVILPAEGRFSAGTFWRDACAHNATFFTAVPTMHQVCVECRPCHEAMNLCTELSLLTNVIGPTILVTIYLNLKFVL